MSKADDEDDQLRSAALQNAASILLARQRAEDELLRTKEVLREETRILELLNETGKTLASNLDLQTVVQAATDAAIELSGAQLGVFLYGTAEEKYDGLPIPMRSYLAVHVR